MLKGTNFNIVGSVLSVKASGSADYDQRIKEELNLPIGKSIAQLLDEEKTQSRK